MSSSITQFAPAAAMPRAPKVCHSGTGVVFPSAAAASKWMGLSVEEVQSGLEQGLLVNGEQFEVVHRRRSRGINETTWLPRRVRRAGSGEMFSSTAMLAKNLGMPRATVRSRIQRRLPINGFIYEFVGEKQSSIPIDRFCQAVRCIDTRTVYESVTATAEAFDCTPSMISAACSEGRPCRGMRFQWVDEERRAKAEVRAEHRRLRTDPNTGRRLSSSVLKPRPRREVSPAEWAEILAELMPVIERQARARVRATGGHADYDDMVSAGLLGLVDAVTRDFEGKRRKPLKCYATKLARTTMLQNYADADKNFWNAYHARVEFKMRSFTRMAGRAADDFDFGATIADRHIDGANTFGDLIEPLHGIERAIIRMMFEADASLEDVAVALGKSLSVVEQIFNSAIATLRESLKSPSHFVMASVPMSVA